MRMLAGDAGGTGAFARLAEVEPRPSRAGTSESVRYLL
jgi:hypothetical protein